MLAAVLLCAACAGGLYGCSLFGAPSDTQAAIEAVKPVPVRVIVYQGPSALGLVDFMDKASSDQLHNRYRCVLSSSPSAVSDVFLQGKADIAVMPTALALNLYASNPDELQMISIASLGGQHVVSARKDLRALEDLAGTTLLMTGPSTMQEYVVRYLLAAKGLTDQVALEFVGDPSDIVAALSTDPEAIGMMAEPYVTAARFKDRHLRSRIDLSAAWREVVGSDASFVTAVAVVRSSFAGEHPEAVMEFLEAQAASVEAYDDDPDALAQLMADMGMVDSFEIAEAVLPSCGMTCLTGTEMRDTMEAFLQALYDVDPSWVAQGQGLPEERFYYGVEGAEAEGVEAEEGEAEDAEAEGVEAEDGEAEDAEAEGVEAEDGEAEDAEAEALEAVEAK